MNNPINIEERKRIWVALSDFYLDTELQDSDFNHIASQIIARPYSFEEVQKINKYEVFPVLQVNLLSVAGEQAGFPEDWLANKIQESLKKRTIINKIAIEGSYQVYKWMCAGYWKKLKTAYDKLTNDF